MNRRRKEVTGSKDPGNTAQDDDVTSTLKVVHYCHQSPKRSRRVEKVQQTPSKIRNACTACREKKTRCSGGMPCFRCERRREACEYFSPPTSQFALEKGTAAAAGRTTSDTPANDARVNTASPAPRSNTVFSGSPEEDTPEESPQEDRYGHFHGSASGFAFLQDAKQRIQSLPPLSLDFTDHPLAEPGNFAPVLPPKSVADRLIHCYFTSGPAIMRFVHRPTFNAVYEKMYVSDDWEGLQPGELALVYMVLGLGAHYSKTDNTFSGFRASVRYVSMARKELSPESNKITLASTQARLLITHFQLNHSRMHEAWSTFGNLVREAQALGLHRKTNRGQVSNYIHVEYRKRLFWSMYIHDRILSSIFGRPCALHDDDIDQEECAFADDDDISQSACHIAQLDEPSSGAALVHYARLCRITGRVLQLLYSPAGRSKGLTHIQNAALDCDKALQDWQHGLPSYLNFESHPSLARSPLTRRQLCTLKLTFTHTTLLLYRPFILHSIGTTISPSSSSSSKATSPKQQWFTLHSYTRSIAASHLTITECSSLNERGLFSRTFWLTNYVQFTAIGTLYLCSQMLRPHDSQGAEAERRRADEALQEFPTGVEGDPVGQQYLELLQGLREMTGSERIAPAGTEVTGSRAVPGEPPDGGVLSINGGGINDTPMISGGGIESSWTADSLGGWVDIAGPWANLLLFEDPILGDLDASVLP